MARLLDEVVLNPEIRRRLEALAAAIGCAVSGYSTFHGISEIFPKVASQKVGRQRRLRQLPKRPSTRRPRKLVRRSKERPGTKSGSARRR